MVIAHHSNVTWLRRGKLMADDGLISRTNEIIQKCRASPPPSRMGILSKILSCDFHPLHIGHSEYKLASIHNSEGVLARPSIISALFNTFRQLLTERTIVVNNSYSDVRATTSKVDGLLEYEPLGMRKASDLQQRLSTLRITHDTEEPEVIGNFKDAEDTTYEILIDNHPSHSHDPPVAAKQDENTVFEYAKEAPDSRSLYPASHVAIYTDNPEDTLCQISSQSHPGSDGASPELHPHVFPRRSDNDRAGAPSKVRLANPVSKYPMSCPFNGSYSLAGDAKYHLLFVIHGATMGSTKDGNNPSFIGPCKSFENTICKVARDAEAFCECRNCRLAHPESKYHPLPSGSGIVVIPVFWRDALDSDYHNSVKLQRSYVPGLECSFKPGEVGGKPQEFHTGFPTMDEITFNKSPRFISGLISITREVMSYSVDNHKDRILKTTAKELNRLYSEFIKRNPNFKGNVSICGHSLGSLIAFDLLSSQWEFSSDGSSKIKTKPSSYCVDFDVENLFMFGSPLAFYLLLRGKSLLIHPNARRLLSESHLYVSPRVKNFYNVFHPNDGVSHLLEPLIADGFPKLFPYKIPFPAPVNYDVNALQIDKQNTKGESTQMFELSLSSNHNFFTSILNIAFLLCRRIGPTNSLDTAVNMSSLSITLTRQLSFQSIWPTETEHPISPHSPPTNSHGAKRCSEVTDALRKLGYDPNLFFKETCLDTFGRLDFVLPTDCNKSSTISIRPYISTLLSHFFYWDDHPACLFVLQQLYKNSLYRSTQIN